MTEEWLKSQTFDIQASLIAGFDLKGYTTFLDYYESLQSAVEAGTPGAASELATFQRRCEVMGSLPNAIDDPEHVNHASAKACATLPGHDRDFAATLLAQASERGDLAATLQMSLYPPRSVMLSPGAPESVQWWESLHARLTELADGGNADAALQVGNGYLANNYGQRDLDRSRSYLQRYLLLSSSNDPRRRAVQTSLQRMCVYPPDGAAPPEGCE